MKNLEILLIYIKQCKCLTSQKHDNEKLQQESEAKLKYAASVLVRNIVYGMLASHSLPVQNWWSTFVRFQITI